jgi:hypothetical protein
MKKVVYRSYTYKGENNKILVTKILVDFRSAKKEEVEAFVERNAKDIVSIGFSGLVAGAEALVNVVAGNTVTQSEINRRSAICFGCKIDGQKGVISANDCMPCGGAAKIARWTGKLKKSLGGGYVIPNNLESKGCAVCKCSLAVMIPSKMSAFEYEKDKQEERPEHCWVKKTSNNYIP